FVVFQGAAVDVGGADQGADSVHGDDLGVEHGRLVLAYADASVEELLVVLAAGQEAGALVGVGAGQEDLHGDAAAGGVGEQAGEVGVGGEVGGGQAQPLPGRGDGDAQQGLHVLPAEAGGAADDRDGGVAGLVLGGEAVVPVVELVVAFGPVLGEGCGDAVDGGAAHLDVGVAPFVRGAGVAA